MCVTAATSAWHFGLPLRRSSFCFTRLAVASLVLVRVLSSLKQHRLLVAVSGLHALVGSWVAMATPGPLLASDDVAYLAMARTLAGHGAAPFAEQPPYGVLYPLLLVPGWALGLNESAMLVWARLLNGLLGAALVPVLYFIVRRLTGASSRWSLVAAVIGASLPAHMATASIAWTERLSALLVALSVLVLHRFVEKRSLGRALGVVAVAVALYATHPRLGVFALVIVLAVPGINRFDRLLRRKRICFKRISVKRISAEDGQALDKNAVDSPGLGRRGEFVVGVLGLMGLVVVEGVRRVVATVTFGGSGTYNIVTLAERRGIEELSEMFLRGTGTLAYLVLASAGLAVVGVVVLWRSPPVGPWVLFASLGVLVVAGWFLTGVPRADGYLHGRYIEVLAPMLVALGVVGLRRIRRVGDGLAVALVIVIAGFWGAWAGPGNNWLGVRSPIMMLGVEAGGAPFGNAVFEPGAAAFVALVVAAMLFFGLRHLNPWLCLTAAIVVLGVGTASNLETLDQLVSTATLSTVQHALADVEITGLAIDAQGLPRTLSGAVTWEVGFDNTSAMTSLGEVSADVSHLLLRVDATPPAQAELVAQVGEAELWALPR